MKQFLITVAAVLSALVLFLIIAPIVIISMIASSARTAPAAAGPMVLSLDLREPLSDQRPQSALAALNGAPALLDVLMKLEAAREDDNVKGLYIRVNTGGMPAAQAEELRTAIAAFRGSGKFVTAHIQNDGVRMSIAGYATAAGADEVWLQGASDMQAMGLVSETSFLADTLQRFHVSAQFESREEYKTAAAPLTQRTFTGPHREETMGLMTGIYDSLVAHIAADRRLTPAAVRAAIEATPMTSAQAVEAKLIDKLGRPEDAAQSALARAGDNARIVEMSDYRAPARTGGAVIAVVQGEGEIVSGPHRASPFGGSRQMNGDEVARALLDASDDDAVKAIVFRVSSPGGSVVASDQILNALRIARSRGKKIVVSMGEVAASGGYYVAADADEIIASPTTITGSIGVLGGKLVIGDALEHYASVHSETLSMGSPMVTMFDSNRPFSTAERAAFASMIDRAYQDFLSLVANGRHMTVAQVREVARGRVWTGQQALERRLVDRLGGFDVAVARARALGGVADDANVQLRFFPTAKSPFEQLRTLFGSSAEGAQALTGLVALARDPRVAEIAAALAQDDAAVQARAGAISVH